MKKKDKERKDRNRKKRKKRTKRMNKEEKERKRKIEQDRRILREKLRYRTNRHDELYSRFAT